VGWEAWLTTRTTLLSTLVIMPNFVVLGQTVPMQCNYGDPPEILIPRGRLPHVGEGRTCILGSIFGILLYLCLRFLTQSDQIRHVERCVFRRSATPLRLHKRVARFVSDSRISCSGAKDDGDDCEQQKTCEAPVTINKPTPSFLQAGWLPFLSPNQQC